MITFIKRITKSGWFNFKRQAYLSFASCSVLIVTISLISFLFLSSVILGFLVGEVRNNADISVYFVFDFSEDEVLDLKAELEAMDEVEKIEIIPKEQALEDFIQRHKEEDELMDSLIELGFNPFLTSLSINASNVEKYEELEVFFSDPRFDHLIEKVDFHKRQEVIQRIFQVTGLMNFLGILVSLIFVFVSVLITFNTVRLAISNQGKEIETMRLVGASNNFIRGPFLIQGAICGLIAFVVSLAIVAIFSLAFTPKIASIFPGFRIFNFFKQDFWWLVLIQFVFGLVLGIVPSFIAIKKYLEI